MILLQSAGHPAPPPSGFPPVPVSSAFVCETLSLVVACEGSLYTGCSCSLMPIVCVDISLWDAASYCDFITPRSALSLHGTCHRSWIAQCQSAELVIEGSRVRFLAAAAGEFCSLEILLRPDAYFRIPPPPPPPPTRLPHVKAAARKKIAVLVPKVHVAVYSLTRMHPTCVLSNKVTM